MDVVVNMNIGLDFAILVLCMANFFSLTATTVALSNHWDAVYTVTGDVSTYQMILLSSLFLIVIVIAIAFIINNKNATRC